MDWKQKEKKHREGVLTFLWEEGFATAEQIKNHIFPHTSDKSLFHRRKLLKMQNKGLINRKQVLFSQSGVYYLTKTGWNTLDIPEAHRLSPTDKDKISVSTGPHRLQVINARLEIEKILSGAPITKYYSERTIKLYPEPLLRKPDMLFISNNKKYVAEIELTYRNSKKTKQIIAYWAYAIQKGKIDYCIFLSDTNAKTQRLQNIIQNQKNQFIQISLPGILFGQKQYRQEKILIDKETLSKIRTGKIGDLTTELFSP